MNEFGRISYEHKVIDRIITVDSVYKKYDLSLSENKIKDADREQIDFQKFLFQEFLDCVVNGEFNPIPSPFNYENISGIRELSNFDWKNRESFYLFKKCIDLILQLDGDKKV